MGPRQASFTVSSTPKRKSKATEDCSIWSWAIIITHITLCMICGCYLALDMVLIVYRLNSVTLKTGMPQKRLRLQSVGYS